MTQRLTIAFALAALTQAGCPALDTSVGTWRAPDASLDASGSQYLEAESGALSGGFVVGSDSSASSGQFLAPPPGSSSDDTPGPARARYTIPIDEAGTYVIWARMRGPSVRANRFWFQVDGGEWVLERLSTGEVWFWDGLHDDTHYGVPLTFPWAAGPHELVLANAVSGVAVDRLYVTARRDHPPGNDTPCSPPHSIEVQGECLPSCGSQNGKACGAAACEGKTRVSAYDCDICCLVP